MHFKRFSIALVTATPMLAFASCAEEGDADDNNIVCAGAKCDAPTDPAQFACKKVVDESQRGRANVLAELQDPISVFVLRGGNGCPTSYKEAVAKLRENDKAGCESGAAAGMSTRFVTETGQLSAGSLLQNFRLVNSRRCNSRNEWELLISLFGVPASGKLPASAELIAFDPEAKEFNYYEIAGGQWHFFGSSSDFVAGKGGRCKGCHTGGGLVMKELDTPWMHWTGHFQTPGTNKVIDANKDDLGSESSGANMESLVNSGNREWTKTRVTNALNPAKGTVADLLRPLFCTVEVNIDNAVDFDTSSMSSLPADFFLDPQLKSFGSIGMKDDVYTAARTAAGNTVPGLNQADTIFKFPFVERSKADNMYIDELKSRGVVDDDFVRDVLMVDFTRPVFSDARCALLEFAPTFEQLTSPPTGGTTDGDPTAGTTTEDPTAGTSGEDPTAGTTGDATGGGVMAGNCCTADESRKGCENDEISMCVCNADAFCCDNSWDATCVEEATSMCMAACGAGVVDGGELELAAAPDVTAADVAVADLRAAFIANLQAANPAAGTAAADLLTSLQAADDKAAHTARVDAFLKACEDRDERELMDDAFKIRQWQHDIAFTLPIFEFEQTLPTTKLSVSPSAHFDTSCKVAE
ncbi:MAG: hypothetical protein IPK74_19695 [Deltaproteobacteria bacterium]|nr:hypothetical protein [Deltaproteobacteria bacterium]